MRIGILTFHRPISYGAVLQAYALRKFLLESGYNAEIVDYRNIYFEKLYYSTEINLDKYEQYKSDFGYKRKIKRIFFDIPYFKAIGRKFLEFQRDYLNIDINSNGISHMFDCGYDFYITGSDQVWNLKLTDNDMTYFLDFTSSNKKISFSASVGGYPIESNEKIVHLLNKFKAISVRETLTNDKLKKIGISDSCVNLDPVFLLTEENWKELTNTKKIKDYILLFEVGRNKDLLNYALEYAKLKHKRLFYLSTGFVRPFNRKIHNLYLEGPQDFLAWIMNADYIFTNSFHGTAFSIIFRKDFYCHVLKKQSSSERMISILQKCGLEDYYKPSKIGHVAPYDLSNLISENRENALAFFMSNLKGNG